eukprot:SAG22_NODE_15270_length_352_cov_3.391304_1_plen_27_part_10
MAERGRKAEAKQMERRIAAEKQRMAGR